MTWVDLGPDDLADGDLRKTRAGDLALGLARAAGRTHVFEAWCTHAECPLTDGWLEGAAVRCACHGALFDLESGAPLEGPADEPIRVFAARTTAGRLQAQLLATDT